MQLKSAIFYFLYKIIGRVKPKEIDWSQERGGPGGTPKKLGRAVRPASQNPYPIYDQNLRFSLWPDQKFDTLFMT